MRTDGKGQWEFAWIDHANRSVGFHRRVFVKRCASSRLGLVTVFFSDTDEPLPLHWRFSVWPVTACVGNLKGRAWTKGGVARRLSL